MQNLPRVIVLMDGDRAGRKAAQVIHRNLPGSTVIDLPEGLDPDDMSDQKLAKLRSLLLF